ncbi:DNA-directed RNA polymerase III subunit RPC10 [Chamberlinius hualienensis]
MLFCPTCGNMLMCVEDDNQGYRYVCNTCPYFHKITKRVVKRKQFTLKGIGDVLGGAAAWENVDSTDAPCPKCNHQRAYFLQLQTRSADEPMTIFYKCCNSQCGFQWKE